MKIMKTLGGGLGLAALSLVSSIAHAELTGNLGLSSEYVFRGVASSGNGAALSGGLDWAPSENLYLGVWGTNTNSADANEFDVYVGTNVGDFDLGVMLYGYPGSTAAKFGTGRGVELYAGYSKDMFSGYVWLGSGSDDGIGDDEYVYVEANLNAPLNDGLEVELHAGYMSGIQDQNSGSNQADLGVTVSYGGLWAGATSVIGSDTVSARVRANFGYTWHFDELPMPKLSFM